MAAAPHHIDPNVDREALSEWQRRALSQCEAGTYCEWRRRSLEDFAIKARARSNAGYRDEHDRLAVHMENGDILIVVGLRRIFACYDKRGHNISLRAYAPAWVDFVGEAMTSNFDPRKGDPFDGKPKTGVRQSP